MAEPGGGPAGIEGSGTGTNVPDGSSGKIPEIKAAAASPAPPEAPGASDNENGGTPDLSSLQALATNTTTDSAAGGNPDASPDVPPVGVADGTTGIDAAAKKEFVTDDLHSRAERFASARLDNDAAGWQKKVDEGTVDVNSEEELPDGAYKLYMYGRLKNGFRVETNVKNLAVGDVVVTRIEPKAGGIYSCTVEGTTKPVDISGEDLAKGWLAKYADAIADTVPANAREVVKWYANGSEGTPPTTDEALTNLENPPDATAPVLQRQIDRLTQDMTDMKAEAQAKAKPGEAVEDVTASDGYKKIQALQAKLEAAIKATGPFGAITRKGVLEDISSQSKQFEVEQLLKPDSAFSQEVATAEQNLEDFFRDKNLSPEQQIKYREALQDPAEFCKLILDTKDPNFTAIGQELADGMFGNLAEDDLNKMYQNLLDTAYIDPVLKGKIERFLTENRGKKLGLLAIILAAIPAVAVGLTAAAAVTTVQATAGGLAKAA